MRIEAGPIKTIGDLGANLAFRIHEKALTGISYFHSARLLGDLEPSADLSNIDFNVEGESSSHIGSEQELTLRDRGTLLNLSIRSELARIREEGIVSASSLRNEDFVYGAITSNVASEMLKDQPVQSFDPVMGDLSIEVATFKFQIQLMESMFAGDEDVNSMFRSFGDRVLDVKSILEAFAPNSEYVAMQQVLLPHFYLPNSEGLVDSLVNKFNLDSHDRVNLENYFQVRDNGFEHNVSPVTDTNFDILMDDLLRLLDDEKENKSIINAGLESPRRSLSEIIEDMEGRKLNGLCIDSYDEVGDVLTIDTYTAFPVS